jgi:hypothetical protein
MKKLLFILSVTALLTINVNAQSEYVPDSPELFKEIVKMDSIFFKAYNNCDIETQASIYSDTIEFYEDKGGLETSKKKILESIKNNVCGKVTRILVKGSIEVYPLEGYGAVEIGLHKFHNMIEDSTSDPAKFIVIWRNRNNKWQITRVISLHS